VSCYIDRISTINNSYATPDDANDVDSDSAVTVSNLLTVTDGQFQPHTGSDFNDVTINTNGILKPDSTNTLTVAGDWDGSAGTFTHNDSTVTFDGQNDATLTLSPGDAFYNVIFNDMGNPSTWTLQFSLIINNDVTITDGELDSNGDTIYIQGDWSNSDTYTHTNSTVNFNGSTAQAITGVELQLSITS